MKKFLPIIIFFSALTSVLYYFGIIQKIVGGFAFILRNLVKISGAESFSLTGNIFLGQTEAPLLIKKYLSKMNNSKSDIALVSNNKILETGTSNILFVKDEEIFTPKKGYYEGNTYKFFKTKIKKIIKKDILIKDIKKYDEILVNLQNS